MSFSNRDALCRLNAHLNICRLCLRYNTNDNPFYNILTDKIQCVNIYDELKNLFDINVEPGDLRPKYICQLCYKKVSEWRDFVLKAHYSQYSINDMIYTTINNQDNYVQQPIIPPSSSVINMPHNDNEDNSNNNPSTSSTFPSISVINMPHNDNQDNLNNNPSTSSTFPSISVINMPHNNNQDNSNNNPSTSLTLPSLSVINMPHNDNEDNSNDNSLTSSNSSNSSSPFVANITDGNIEEHSVNNPSTSSNSSSPFVVNLTDDNIEEHSVNNPLTSSNSPSPSIITIPDDDSQDNFDNYSSTSLVSINNLSNDEDNQENSYCMPSTSTANRYMIRKRKKRTFKLYSCIILSCQKSFKTFQGFKTHYRRHRNVVNAVMCWTCNNTFPNMSTVHSHHMKRECVVFPGMFRCASCSESFDDLQSLSIHKYNMHIQ